MPAVPASVESDTNSSTSTADDRERPFAPLFEESDVAGLAFTIIDDDTPKDSNNDDEGIDTDQAYLDEEFEKDDEEEEVASYGQFKDSQNNQKVLNRSNAYILQQKLMNLSKSSSNSHKQTSGSYGKVINNLKVNPSLNKSRSKDTSKSFNNNYKKYQADKIADKGHKKYHLYCHLPSSDHSYNNMTAAVRHQPSYDHIFSDPKKVHDQNGNNNNYIKSEKNNRNNYHHQNGYNKLNEKNAKKERKPLFITTVKSGKFLDPPPELATLLGLNYNLNDSVTSSGSSNSLDKHQQQVLLYSFSSQPRVLHQHHHRARCTAANSLNNSFNTTTTNSRSRRDTAHSKSEDGQIPYGNIMYDRRVIRGSTYAQHPVPTQGESQAARQQEARRRALARRKAQGQKTRNERYRLGTPPPVSGRKHEPVQTEKYLEEIFDHPPVEDAFCQTELFWDRPPSPVYVPEKTGHDRETQIYPGELFDFDLEVKPILEVLVGKTIDQSLQEVLEEEELAALRAQQRRFLELRNGEKAEQQRLEEQDRRLRVEKERRLAESREAAEVEKETEERIAASVLLQSYLADLLPSVLEGLKDAGYLLDNIKAGAGDFMPWLMNEVTQEVNYMITSREILADIVKEVLETRAEIYRVMGEEDAKLLGIDTDEEEEPPPPPVEPEPRTLIEEQSAAAAGEPESRAYIRAPWD